MNGTPNEYLLTVTFTHMSGALADASWRRAGGGCGACAGHVTLTGTRGCDQMMIL